MACGIAWCCGCVLVACGITRHAVSRMSPEEARVRIRDLRVAESTGIVGEVAICANGRPEAAARMANSRLTAEVSSPAGMFFA